MTHGAADKKRTLLVRNCVSRCLPILLIEDLDSGRHSLHGSLYILAAYEEHGAVEGMDRDAPFHVTM